MSLVICMIMLFMKIMRKIEVDMMCCKCTMMMANLTSMKMLNVDVIDDVHNDDFIVHENDECYHH